MTNRGGTTDGGPDDGRRAKHPAARDGVEEPTLLGADWPEPSTWGPVLGAGGEELVPIGGGESERSHDAPPPRAHRRRPSRRSLSARATGSRERPRVLTGRLGRGALTTLGVAGGLVGLAILLVSAVFSIGGDHSRQGEETAIATVAPLPSADTRLAAIRKEKARLQARLRDAARARRTAVEAARRDERRRERARRAVRDAPPSPPTAQVVTTTPRAPAPQATPTPSAPTASPAEREFTPGPWNES